MSQIVLDLEGMTCASCASRIERGLNELDGVEASVLAAKAQGGIARVAEAVPTDAGEDVVRAIRASVWGAPDEELGGLPLGAAFAAMSMGFISGAFRAG